MLGLVVIWTTGTAATPLPAQRGIAVTVPPSEAWVRRLLDRSDGLPEAQVNAIAQTDDGYFWLGTRRGLVRYDGLRYTLYDPANTPALPAPWINGLRADGRGRIWLATAGGLAVREGGTFRRVDSTQVPSVDVWSTHEDRRGAIWVATEDGLFVGDGVRFRRVRGATGFLYSLAEDGRGRIWIGGRRMFGYVDGDSVVDLTAALRIRGRVFTLYADGPDRLWFGTTQGATELQLDAKGTPRVRQQVSTALGSMDRAVWTVGRGPDSTLWLGTETSGTLMFADGQLHEMSRGPLETWTLFADRNGVMWAGTGSGLERYQRTPFRTMRDGLPNNPVWSTRIAPWGELWASVADGSVHTWTGGRFRLQLRGGAIEQSSPTAAGGDAMFLGAQSTTLVRIDGKGRQARVPLSGPPIGTYLGLLANGGDLWISADSGLYRLREGQLQSMNAAFGREPGSRPHEMALDSAGRLYFGRPGLTVVEGTSRRHFGEAEGLTGANVRAILPRGEFTWIGTLETGLFVLHRNRIHALGRIDPRLDREVLALGDDTDGHLWISWSYGLMRVELSGLEAAVTGRRVKLRIRNFDQTDGLPAGSFRGDFQSQLPRDAEGALYLPNALGVVRVDPRGVGVDTAAPPVIVEGISVDGTPAQPLNGLRLAAGVGRVEFTLATPGAMRPTEVRLQYRLVGVDSAWIDAGLRRTFAFGPLRGGNYRFEARSSTEEGAWSPSPKVVSLDVALTISEQPWFLPLLLGATGALVLVTTRARRVFLERRAQALEQEVAERTADLEAARATLERRVAERTAQLAGELAERERLQHALIEAQKLEGLGRLAGGVAHEINNGMASVLGFTELAAIAARDRHDVISDLNEVRRAGDRVKAIVRQLMLFARREHVERTLLDVGDTVRELTRTLQELVGPKTTLQVEVTGTLPPVNGNGPQLEQVVVNLVVNARDAMPDGGTITVQIEPRSLPVRTTLGSVDLDAGEYVVLSVRDTGAGISESVRSRLFEPFFTTKKFAAGTGLGLAVSHGIVREHGGAIVVTSTLGAGATFDVWLPADGHALPASTAHDVAPDAPVSVQVAAVTDTPPKHPNAEDRPSRKATILLVDDDDGVRATVRRQLEHAGYRVLVADGGLAALALAEGRYAEVDLVLTDFKMPDLDGLALARELRSRHGARPTVFMSGYAGYAPDAEDELATFGPLLAKPVSIATLQDTLRASLDAAQPRAAGAE